MGKSSRLGLDLYIQLFIYSRHSFRQVERYFADVERLMKERKGKKSRMQLGLVNVGTSAAVRLKSPAFRSLTSFTQLFDLKTDTFVAQGDK